MVHSKDGPNNLWAVVCGLKTNQCETSPTTIVPRISSAIAVSELQDMPLTCRSINESF
jgi:siroheme synthase